MCAIDLLERDDQRHLVLESEGTEGPKKVRRCAHVSGESIRAAHEQCARLAGIAFDPLYFFRERAAGKLFSAFVEYEAKAPLAAAEQLAAFAQGIGRLDMRGFHGGKAPQPREIFGDASASMRESRLANCNDTPAQSGELFLMADRIEIRGVVGASDEGPAGDKFESLASGDLAVKGEGFGIDIFDYRQVLGSGAKVLPHGKDLHVSVPEIIEGFEEFVLGLAQAEHKATLSHNFGCDVRCSTKNLERETVFCA